MHSEVATDVGHGGVGRYGTPKLVGLMQGEKVDVGVFRVAWFVVMHFIHSLC